VLSITYDENLPIINKTKHPTKGRKKVQDGRTQVLTNKESSKERGPLGEWEQQIKYPTTPHSRDVTQIKFRVCGIQGFIIPFPVSSMEKSTWFRSMHPTIS
jgi:hypothetical protein